jgi:hypothetical protein
VRIVTALHDETSLDLIFITIDRSAQDGAECLASLADAVAPVLGVAPADLATHHLLRAALGRAWASTPASRPDILAAVREWLARPPLVEPPPGWEERLEARMRAEGLLGSWQGRAVAAWRTRQAERILRDDADVTMSAAREERDEGWQAELERVPEELRAAYEWMVLDGAAAAGWPGLDPQDLGMLAYSQQEAAANVEGRVVPAESIVALAAWLRRGDG